MYNKQLDNLIETLENFRPLLPEVEIAGCEIVRAIKEGKKILTAGNGGSAADALHLAEEMIGRFDKERAALPALALCADPTVLTCIGNDFGFDQIYARQIEGLGRPGDVLVIFSTSGNSSNLINGLQVAKEARLKTIALLGKDGGLAKGIADHEIIVPSSITARIQEIHTFILHFWLNQIEKEY